MISIPHYAISVPQCLWVSVDRMQIDVIHYHPLTLCYGILNYLVQWLHSYTTLSCKIRKAKDQSFAFATKVNRRLWILVNNYTMVDFFKQKWKRKHALESAQYELGVWITHFDYILVLFKHVMHESIYIL